jgi:hypothetical protein
MATAPGPAWSVIGVNRVADPSDLRPDQLASAIQQPEQPQHKVGRDPGGQPDELPVQGGTDTSAGTPEDVATAQRQLKPLQWSIPALTGAVLVINARMGEQQRHRQLNRRAARAPPDQDEPLPNPGRRHQSGFGGS